ncbi:hypothetical protein MNEG_8763 [Monoraphidium neglectum]|uniref:Protein phosphatase n=1 Tax=Monoraphidium neglectum TaxID=145388 RepID=A0A0D2MER8_9CHLO|nr:hypothetical protein MNEG_8763 [Monoraphidium neglectum]KIY99196.1 hypothetical protein MNEG_8763 [Monoraphidium neglectum]|eukprot:XP_013898216.1 hypothetical protein MNEG_8763 [Monoraphidium neglectum]
MLMARPAHRRVHAMASEEAVAAAQLDEGTFRNELQASEGGGSGFDSSSGGPTAATVTAAIAREAQAAQELEGSWLSAGVPASNGASSGTSSGAAAAAVADDDISSISSSSTSERDVAAASDDSSTGSPSSSSSSSSSSGDSLSSAPALDDPAAGDPPAKPRGPAAAPPVLMTSGASMLPHPEKAHRGGEDAFFIAEPPLSVGVADGVGGWAEIGVDAGAYARLFMVHAKEEAEALLGGDAALSPQTVLERAYYRTNVQGSSTVCILSLNGSTLCASNLGDSGFVLVRDGGAAFQSPQQQHNFNFPYQLGSADGGASDHPQSAMRFELTVQPGDIVITGTDGLWDNVFAEEAATIVARCRVQGDGPEAAAHALCRYARMRATDPKYHSPFSYSAIQAGYVFLGGGFQPSGIVWKAAALLDCA